jgi:hypothetical protein
MSVERIRLVGQEKFETLGCLTSWLTTFTNTVESAVVVAEVRFREASVLRSPTR